MQDERRKHPRQFARIKATLVTRDGIDRIPVAVTDISEAGARVRLDADGPLQGDIYMLVPDHAIRPCRLVWHHDGSFGFSFLQSGLLPA